MSPAPVDPPPQPLATYVAEGARIAAIVLAWNAIGVGFVLAFALPASVVGVDLLALSFSAVLGVSTLVGLLNAVAYVGFRWIDYWRAGPDRR